MSKIMYAILIVFAVICLCAYLANCQDTNVHASFGLHQNVSAGADLRRDKNLVSADVEYLKVCKDIGGCGRQYDVRVTYAREIGKNISIQGGFVYSYYRVPLFDKSSFQPLIGIRASAVNERVIVEANYRHDLTSENKIRAFEMRGTTYLPKHIFIRSEISIRKLISGGNRYTDPRGRLGFGVYF